MLPLLRLLGLLRPYWHLVAGALLCVVGNTLLTLAIPALVGAAVDDGIRRGDLGALERTSIYILVLSAVRAACAFGQSYLAESAAQGVSYSLRAALFDHVQQLAFSFHDRAQRGDLVARATADVEALRNFCGRGVVQLLNLGLLLGGVAVALLHMNWQLAILSVIVLPAVAWRTERYSRRVRPLYAAVQQEIAALAARVQENVAGVRVVRAFGREPEELRRFEEQNDRVFERSLAAARETALNAPLLDFAANVSTVLLLWVAGMLVVVGRLTFGELVAFYTYLLQLVSPIRRGGWLVTMAARAGASAERVFELLDTPVGLTDRPGARPLERVRGAIEFDRVSCAYAPGRPAVQDVSFRVEPGETVALVGATGSGKTTIANLIPRFYDVTDGRVLIDGLDVRDIQLQSLRRQIGMVFQETVLFSGTVRENIAFGRPDATDDEIAAAARAAGAEEFIVRLPNGYHTLVGERGVSLSGGQRQRIAIARALLMDPRVLILDEFTSSVDALTERAIREALSRLMRGRTTIVIAHRLATVMAADRILVMDGGRLVAEGDHRTLLATSAVYRRICEAQLLPEQASAGGDLMLRQQYPGGVTLR